jgi:hypothetical protein
MDDHLSSAASPFCASSASPVVPAEPTPGWPESSGQGWTPRAVAGESSGRVLAPGPPRRAPPGGGEKLKQQTDGKGCQRCRRSARRTRLRSDSRWPGSPRESGPGIESLRPIYAPDVVSFDVEPPLQHVVRPTESQREPVSHSPLVRSIPPRRAASRRSARHPGGVCAIPVHDSLLGIHVRLGSCPFALPSVCIPPCRRWRNPDVIALRSPPRLKGAQ